MNDPTRKNIAGLIQQAMEKEKLNRRPLIIFNTLDYDSVLAAWVYWKRFGFGSCCDVMDCRAVTDELVANKEVFIIGHLFGRDILAQLKRKAQSLYVLETSDENEQPLTLKAFKHCYGSLEVPIYLIFSPSRDYLRRACTQSTHLSRDLGLSNNIVFHIVNEAVLRMETKYGK